MKTTLDIPEKALEDVMRFTAAKTKREAVVTAVEDFNRRCRLKEMGELLGSFDGFLSLDELHALRNGE